MGVHTKGGLTGAHLCVHSNGYRRLERAGVEKLKIKKKLKNEKKKIPNRFSKSFTSQKLGPAPHPQFWPGVVLFPARFGR